MALDSKMEYTQADGALTLVVQTVTFSIDGTNEIKPNAVIISNEETSGTKVVKVCLNSNDTVVRTLSYGQKMRYSIKRVKQLKLLRDAAGAPNYRVNGVL